ncbi:sortase [Lapillicoccus jejuensis]|uniref:Sortase A n=1 Tax=Lapillicoccus jejuensis TaxID=402171 RepID=A0A542E199_9MICO|nr:sortase [Lapillicoccus jejuensis]TQJ09102.1 sortase A [Lapillicoccus jejuensis]
MTTSTPPRPVVRTGPSPTSGRGERRAAEGSFHLPPDQAAHVPPSGPEHAVPVDPRAWAVRIGGLVLFAVLAMLMVAYPMGPVFSAKAQVDLTRQLQSDVSEAYGAANDSLDGASAPTRALPVGSPVALLQVSRLGEQQAVVEGAGPAQTRDGVAHVAGTPAPGQPGNAVLVGRRTAFGGPFGDLTSLRPGDPVLVLTAQGRSVYQVTTVTHGRVDDTVYDPSDDDRLTLLSSDSALPWSGTQGVTVVATLKGKPFVPTPQNGFSPELDGRHADPTAWPLLLLEVLALAGGVVGAVVAYRRWSRPMAYLVTTPPLVALVVFTALTATRLLPGWA